MAGILDKEYHNNRKKRIDFIYRLNRRTSEVKKIIEKQFRTYYNLNYLDVGTADGLMLSRLNNIFHFKKAIGIDISEDLIKTNKDKNIELKIASAENLCFDDNSFDIITACAVIEHVDNPNKMLSECRRVLKEKGVLIITTPNPFHDKIAEKIGYFKKENHVKTFNLEDLVGMLEDNDFKILSQKYFMFFPFFKISFEQQIENLIRSFGIGRIMTNQIIIGIK